MTHERGRIPIAYLLYGLAAFLLLVVIFFPYQRLAKTLIDSFERKTGIELFYQDMSYNFPAGCSFDQVEIFVPLGTGRLRAYKGESLSVGAALLPLLWKDLKLRFQGKGFGGDAAGKARLQIPVRPEHGTYHLTVKDVRYEEIVAPFYLRNFKVKGALTGEAELELQGMDYSTSWTGTLKAALNKGMVSNLFVEGMPLPDFEFETIKAKAKLEKGKIHVESFHIDSEVLLADMQGEIDLHPEDLRDSRLDLEARFKPMEDDPVNLHGVAAFYGKDLDSEGYYPFKLVGSFRYPELK